MPKIETLFRRERYISKQSYLQALKTQKSSVKYKKVYGYFNDRLRSVEVIWGDKGLFQIHFIKPRECDYLSEELIESIKRGILMNDDEKVRTFLSKSREIHWDMEQKMLLANNNLHLLLLFQDELLSAITYLAVVINFIIVISLEKGYLTGFRDPQYSVKEFVTVMKVLTILQAILTLYKLFQTSLVRVPLIIKG